MKKVLFSFLAVLFLAACEGPMGPPGRPGPPGLPGVDGAVWRIFDYEIRNSNWSHTWQWTGDSYVCIISIPQLTRQVYDDGIVMVFHEWNDNGTWRQQPLPQSIPMIDGDVLFTEHIDFDYFIGGIRIFFTISDFHYENWQPGTHFFRVVFLL